MGGYCESSEASNELVLEVALPFGNEQTTFHLLALTICNVLASIAIAISVWHIMMHTLHYLRPYEQKHIIRILAIIPIYAWTTFLAYVFYNHAIFYELVRDCYAAYAVASFFTLMCHYIAPNLHEQKQYFRNVKPKNWGRPLNWLQKITGGEDKGWLRKPISGVTWFNVRVLPSEAI
jgi:glucan phosphoethanolaminetransferase (alkaline phosphatase superfamily)